MVEDHSILDLLVNWEEASARGDAVSLELLCRDCPDLLPELRIRVQRLQNFDQWLDCESISNRPFPILPDYEVIREIGRGGMGVVYEACDRQLNRLVAIKMPSQRRRQADRQQFLREARTLAKLRHPNIVPIYEANVLDDQPYFVMELVSGGSLSEHSQRFRDPVAAVNLIVHVLSAIAHAHSHGVMHRDLKHSNILLDEESRPLVGDFGISAIVDGGEASTAAVTLSDIDCSNNTLRTPSGGAVGTPAYMAPEQYIQAGQTGVSQDIWSVGVILYDLLTGIMPFSAPSRTELSRRVILEAPPTPSTVCANVPRDLDVIVSRCLAKDPADRFATAEDLKKHLEVWLNELQLGRTGRFLRNNRVGIMIALTCSILAMSSGLMIAISKWQRHSNDANLVTQFIYAPPDKAIQFVDDLRHSGPGIVECLRQSHAKTALDSPDHLRATLGITICTGELGEELLPLLLTASPEDVRIACACAFECVRDRKADLRNLVLQGDAPGSKRLRAACLLANIDTSDALWPTQTAQVSELLTSEPSELVMAWARLLAPLKEQLIPFLKSSFNNRSQNAARALASYYQNDPGELIKLVCQAEPNQLAPLLAVIPSQSTSWALVLDQAAAQVGQLLRSDKALTDDLRAVAAANLIIAFIKANHVPSNVVTQVDDARIAVLLTCRLPVADIDCESLLRQLDSDHPAWLRQSMLLALGDMPSHKLSDLSLQHVLRHLEAIIQTDPDAGIHSAAHRLQLLLKAGFQRVPTSVDPPAHRRWWMTPSGVSMVTFGDFAIATREVTRGEFQEFRPIELPSNADFDCPVSGVDATSCESFCNWLSEREGLSSKEWCYEPELRNKCNRMRLKSNYSELRGYRLPFAQEWEIAADYPGGIKTFFARNDDILPRFAWFRENGRNRVWPVGSLMPNRHGLFDTFGNVSEWCADLIHKPELAEPTQAYRGMSIVLPVSRLEQFGQGDASPGWKVDYLGFRLARSIVR